MEAHENKSSVEEIKFYMSRIIETDIHKMDIPLVLGLLKDTHWAAKRDPKLILKSFETSLCFGIFEEGHQIGFGRVITDYATTAYLCDMVVVPNKRGCGVGAELLDYILKFPAIKDLKWILRTKNAASLYARFNFKEAVRPGVFMEKFPQNEI